MPHCRGGGFKAEGFLEPFGELPGHFHGEPVTPERQDRDSVHQGAFVNWGKKQKSSQFSISGPRPIAATRARKQTRVQRRGSGDTSGEVCLQKAFRADSSGCEKQSQEGIQTASLPCCTVTFLLEERDEQLSHGPIQDLTRRPRHHMMTDTPNPWKAGDFLLSTKPQTQESSCHCLLP